MSTDNDLYELIKTVSDQAKYLLSKEGEFYPVAAVLDEGGFVRIVALNIDDDYPEVENYLEQLLSVLGEYHSYSIAINVKTTSIKGSTDAIQLKTVYQEENYVDYFIPYFIDNGKIHYQDLITLD